MKLFPALLMTLVLPLTATHSARADDAPPSPAPASPAPSVTPAAPAPPAGILPLPDYSGDIFHRSAITGDWAGTRTALANKGLQLDVDWTQYMQSITQGGLDPTTAYGAHADYLLHLDLMRMNLVPGGLVTIRAESRYGKTVNGDVGTILPANTTGFFPVTSNVDDDVPIAVTDLNYTQLLSEQFALTLGKLDTLDADQNEFASGRGKSQFMDANFIFNSTLALRLPYSTLGVAAKWMPAWYFSLTGSVVNTDDSSTTSGFDDFGKGSTATVEADAQYRLGQLPGGMNLGGLYSFNQDFAALHGRLIFQPGQGLVVPTTDQTWAVYWSGWQYLYVADPSNKPVNLGNGLPDHHGIGLFSRFGFADESTNPVKWSGSFGMGGRGLIPTRNDDVYGLGYYYSRFQTSRFSDALDLQNQAQGFEAFYNLAITPATHLTFDAQIQDPSISAADNAVILGLRLNLAF